MADYYPLVARAVANLSQNTEAARHALYERARNALATQLRGYSEPEVARERQALEEAIRKIEMEANNKLLHAAQQPERLSQKPVDRPPEAAQQAVRAPPTQEVTRAARPSSATRLAAGQPTSNTLLRISPTGALSLQEANKANKTAELLASKRVPPTNGELVSEIGSENIDKVRAMPSSGANANARGEGGIAAMMGSSLFGPKCDACRKRTRNTVPFPTEARGSAQMMVCEDCAGQLKKEYADHTALMVASKRGHLDVVQALLAKGADVNGRSHWEGSTALMLASMQGHLDVVQALLAKGADVNGRSPEGSTALMMAAEQGHCDVVRALLDKGAEVNAKVNNGATALMSASNRGHLDVVQALLAKGADVNAQTSACKTALLLASQEGHRDVVQVLLNKGAIETAEMKASRDSAKAVGMASEKAHRDTEFVCAECRKVHRLAVDSFMMSPEQVARSLHGTFGLVIELGGVSREYLVGQLQGFQPHARSRLENDTLEAAKHALKSLHAGQLLNWRCRDCEFEGNEFPASWRPEKMTEWPYPSDGYFREASKNLVAEHGSVVHVTDCGSLTAVRWRFAYKDGHEVVVGNPGWPVRTMKVDIDCFPGMVGPEGKTYAKVFFTSAGLDTSGLDIFGMPNGAAYNVTNNGKLLEK